MQSIEPQTAAGFAATLAQFAASEPCIRVAGNGSKPLGAGPMKPAGVCLSTRRLANVLRYEPNDLTISVEAGMRFRELQTLLAGNRQMIALDPPYSVDATIGGVVATNGSGPMRCLYGTARDLVIGMSFATLDGKIASSGGMVVKNVAGLDMGKMLIGSFGTLAVMLSINFRLHPLPERMQSFLFSFDTLGHAIEKRDSILRSYLRPVAMDLLSPVAATRLGLRRYVLAIRAAGSQTVLARYARELTGSETLTGETDEQFWIQVREFTPEFLRRTSSGIVLRLSTPLTGVGAVLKLSSGAAISRAATGVTYVYLTSPQAVLPFWHAAAANGWSAAVEYAPHEFRASSELWLLPSDEARQNGFAMMKRVKQMFDPRGCLNPLRLYGRI